MSDEQDTAPEAVSDTEEGASKKSSARKASMAYLGKPFHPEDIPHTPPPMKWGHTHNNQMFVDQVTVPNYDFADMRAVNQAINMTRVRLFEAKGHVDTARRKMIEAENNYRHTYNRILIGLSGATEKIRVATAELMSGEEKMIMDVARVEFEELKNLQFRLSDDLQVLQTLASNIRSEMNLR